MNMGILVSSHLWFWFLYKNRTIIRFLSSPRDSILLLWWPRSEFSNCNWFESEVKSVTFCLMAWLLLQLELVTKSRDNIGTVFRTNLKKLLSINVNKCFHAECTSLRAGAWLVQFPKQVEYNPQISLFLYFVIIVMLKTYSLFMNKNIDRSRWTLSIFNWSRSRQR